MSPNRRIFLNIVATYGRSLYALAIGLFSGRWILMSLGTVDYGLLGLVGGLVAFVSFFNGVLANSVCRFYAVAVGASHKAGNEIYGLEECRKWFNTALSIHTALPVILILIGYPVGVWAIRNFLTIPVDRVADCIWVWRFVCISCFIGMVSVPYSAMYTAKQEIAELTIYGFATTTLNVCFVYYMVTHPGVWLTKYSLWSCFLGVAPNLIIAWRALAKYPECRVVLKYWYDKFRYMELIKYVLAKIWSDFSSLVANQGNAILVNKFKGPSYNAAMTVGTTVAGHTMTLAGAMSGAFTPAISNLCGEGDWVKMRNVAFTACRMGSLVVLVFSIPVALEINELLRLWLVNPPDFAAEICVAILVRGLMESMSDGYAMAIYGKGYRIAQYAGCTGTAGILSVFVALALFLGGFGMWSIVIGILFSEISVVVIRLAFGKLLVNFDAMQWCKKVSIPVVSVGFLAAIVGILPRTIMTASFLRVVMTTAVCETILLPAAWLFVLNSNERKMILSKIKHTFVRSKNEA